MRTRRILTKKRNLTPYESDEQTALVAWARYFDLFLISIPNGAKRSYGLALKEKAMGLYPGACDLLLIHPTEKYKSYFIEMKRRGEKPRKDQLEFMQRAREKGFKAEWFDDWVLAKESIEEYLGMDEENASEQVL